MTSGISDFQSVMSAATQTLKGLDADAEKVLYSRLVDLLLAVFINKVCWNTKMPSDRANAANYVLRFDHLASLFESLVSI